jgi:fluoride exporter
MRDYLLVAVGSALGGAARFGVYSLMARATGFPWGTLAVNYLGSFLIGWIAATQPSPGTRLLWMTGICGGFTTFSAFSLDAISLARDGQAPKAFTYVAASVIGCLAATWLGFRLRA